MLLLLSPKSPCLLNIKHRKEVRVHLISVVREKRVHQRWHIDSIRERERLNEANNVHNFPALACGCFIPSCLTFQSCVSSYLISGCFVFICSVSRHLIYCCLLWLSAPISTRTSAFSSDNILGVSVFIHIISHHLLLHLWSVKYFICVLSSLLLSCLFLVLYL